MANFNTGLSKEQIMKALNTGLNGMTAAEVQEAISDAISNKADKSTTLSGYGITDAYTKTEVNTSLDAKQDSLDETQLSAVNSGITADKVTAVDDHLNEIDQRLATITTHHYGFKIDKNNSDPTTNVSYTHDAVGMTPAYMDYTNDMFNYGSWKDVWFIKNAYPVALTFDGREDYKLDPDDYSKKSDGTASDVSNSSYQGNFMMAFPIVWFKRYEDSSYNYIEIADRKIDDSFEAFAHTDKDGTIKPYIYLPLFKGSMVDGKLRSIANVNPQNFTTADAEIAAAEACGSNWQMWDHSSRELINDLLVLISRSTDCQTKFGRGRESGYVNDASQNYGILKTGTLLNTGMFYGSNTSLSEVKVFGMESFWANRWDRMQGLLLVNGVYKVKMTPPYNLTGTNFVTPSGSSCPTTSAYLKTVSTTKYGSLPSTVGGSSTTYWCDYFYQTQSGTRVSIVGSGCDSGAGGGFRFVDLRIAASASHWFLGASPVYK